jgi:hypothetical protein
MKKSSSGYSVLNEDRCRKIVFCPIFLVKKDNSTSRFIFDGRKWNAAVLPPPPVNLPSMEDLLKKLIDDPNQPETPTQWSFILADFRHWFHQLRMPADVLNRIGVKIRDAKRKMRYFGYNTLPMGFAWSPFLAEGAAWATLLHREKEAQCLFKIDHTVERIPRFVSAIDKEGDTIGFACIMYDNVIVCLRNQSDDVALKFADRLLTNCKHFQVKVKIAEVFTPAETGMRSYEVTSGLSSLKRDRAGRYLPTGERLPQVLGVEFESKLGSLLRWRHSAKREVKASSLLVDSVAWTPRAIAVRVGLAVWHAIVKRSRLGNVRDIIEALKSFTIEKKSDWDKPIDAPSSDWLDKMNGLLQQIVLNGWNTATTRIEGSLFLCASDASDTLLGGVIIGEMGTVARSFSRSVSKDLHIFIKEALAAHMTLDFLMDQIEHSGEKGARMRIAIDNTAARRAFERGYSTNITVNRVVTRFWKRADALGASLEAFDIASEHNVGDCLTCDNEKRIKEHGHADCRVCAHRLFRTVEVLHGRMPGRDVSNPGSRPISTERLAFMPEVDLGDILEKVHYVEDESSEDEGEDE